MLNKEIPFLGINKHVLRLTVIDVSQDADISDIGTVSLHTLQPLFRIHVLRKPPGSVARVLKYISIFLL